jgi:hypothetical protein
MKHYLKGSLALLIGVVLFYTACKKIDGNLAPVTQNKTTTPTVGADAVSSQVALNLVQSLNGSYGGVSVKNGINIPDFADKTNHGHHGGKDSVCGFFIDTAINYDTNVGDSIKSHSHGSIYFFLECGKNGHHDGFTADDSLLTIGTAPGYSFVFDVTQHYVVKSGNPHDNIIMVTGNLKSFVDISFNNTSIKPTIGHDVFDLHELSIDLSDNLDIIHGSASFETVGSNSFGNWDLKGTIVFIGGHKAKITILGKTYTIDLLTGKILP